ncbi:uncharacterized protein EKO05_0007940 [Ascochyta rabiei]|uniref:Uncharacterized protein n=1 Tax=Didymella rabiei TaxID=5454 RepID=A0A163CAX8_DIDRA|nr:uncharacterized protein EKO05_0007940 [Ascochyta rabiei]KZM22331.1 hypothetical protein ST47_g6525 [Ascochyta rabiei]UPX17596.1 hypothetical protein EKO05_0007940 [Ascochyta rabiei]
MLLRDSSTLPRTLVARPDTKALPRILCLHGGGVNAAIFEAQSRSLIRHLETSFHLVWANAPFFCDPHPDVVEVYGPYGPFRRWLRAFPEHAEIDDEACIEEIGYAMRTAMENDSRKGATGEWVGLMGFSQGSKVCASILLEQQAREARAEKEGELIVPVGLTNIPNLHWRFGILMAGSAPLINLKPEILTSPALIGAGDIPSERFWAGRKMDKEAVVRIPTLHVHGSADAGIHLHQKLLYDYCSKESTRLVEWEGTHRVPLRSRDVVPVVHAIYDTAEKTGVRVNRPV